MPTADWVDILQKHVRQRSRVTVLTGAGISAESGIPTFRGPEGYWTVGSQVYQPQEMATFALFCRRPDAVWQWYLHRATVCQAAAPNPGHAAVADMDRLLGERFLLITQNVDGLHLRAGSPAHRTYQIHGNVFQVRCAASCTTDIGPLPAGLVGRPKDAPLTDAERSLLICPRCGERLRPHVLWFDEVYDEPHFRFHSSLQAAAESGLLLVVGTSGATNLPNQVAWTVFQNGGTILDVNPDPNPFSVLACRSPGGIHIRQPSGRFLPEVVRVLQAGPAPRTDD